MLLFKYMKNSSVNKSLNKNQLDYLFGNKNPSKIFGGNEIGPIKPITDRWVTVGGDSQFDNRLVSISTWQTGQVS